MWGSVLTWRRLRPPACSMLNVRGMLQDTKWMPVGLQAHKSSDPDKGAGQGAACQSRAGRLCRFLATPSAPHISASVHSRYGPETIVKLNSARHAWCYAQDYRTITPALQHHHMQRLHCKESGASTCTEGAPQIAALCANLIAELKSVASFDDEFWDCVLHSWPSRASLALLMLHTSAEARI